METSYEKIVQLDISEIVSINAPCRQRKSIRRVADFPRSRRADPTDCCFPRSADDNRVTPCEMIDGDVESNLPR